MRTITVLRSEWEANLEALKNTEQTPPTYTTIGPKPTSSWENGKYVERRSPPSAEDMAALRSFAAALPDFTGVVEEAKGWQRLPLPSDPSGNYRSVLVQLRGERSCGPFDFWGEGKKVYRFRNSGFAVDIDLVHDDAKGIREDADDFQWYLRSEFQAFLERLPPSHRRHRSLNLKPYAACPISENIQAGLIANLPADTSVLRGWVLTGPPGTSKTTYATAALIDLWTLVKHAGFNLMLYRVEVPGWLAETAAWESRDFDEDWPTPQPEISASGIQRSGGFPVLWLEELDKFKPTETRLNYLYSLVNSVYERNGLIIVTCNDTESELRERLGPPISRRIFGDNDEPEAYLHWSLFAAAAGGGKQKRKAP